MTRRLRVEPLEDRTVPAALVGLTDTNSLLRFDSATPGTVTTVAVTGLAGGETLLGIDFRPANGLLYAVSNQNRLLTLNPTTGAATLVAPLIADPTDATNPFTTLGGTALGFDFNPVPDRLRVVSDTNQNLRINPDTGTVITDADLNPGAPDVVGSAYLNNFAGTTVTTLYGIDAATEQLVIQSPPNNGTLATVGANLGAGITAGLSTGFDIVTTGGPGTRTNTAFATLTNGGLTRLYTIDLTAGTATVVGAIGAGTTVFRGLAVVPAGTLNFSIEAFAATESGGTATVTVTRTGGSLGAVSVDFAATAGTATGGADFTGTTGTVNFADGDTAPKTFTVAVLNDLLAEGVETINLALSNATNGSVVGARGAATLNIRDDDSPPDLLYAVTNGPAQLVLFDAAAPGTILRTVALTGLGAGDLVQGIDTRPATGELYALVTNGATGRLAVIDPTTGVVTTVAPLAADPADATAPFTTLAGSDFGFDFNPTNDRLRIVSDGDENLLVDPATGLVTTQTALNPGTPNVVGSGYTNSFAGAGSTTLFAVDSGTDQLFTQNPPVNGTLVLVGALGVNVIDNAGFEISAAGNEAFAALIPAGVTQSGLYTINLTTGAATRLGTIGGGIIVNGLTVAPAGVLNFSPAAVTVNEDAGTATLTVTRIGGSSGAVTATVGVAGGTATPGTDFALATTVVTFADGDTAPKTVTLTVLLNPAVEPDETVQLALGGPTGGAALGPAATATVTIADARTRLAAGGPTNGTAAVFGPGAGTPFDPTPLATLSPFGAIVANVRTATGDVNGDGFPDSVLVTGPGVPLRLAVINGTDGAVLVAPFDPFGDPSFTGGGFVAVGDLDNDGTDEFVVTPDEGGGPRVSVFTRNADGSTTVRANFLGIDDAAFRGGARAALGDVNGDNTPDVIVAAGFGGGPRTAIFTGQSVLAGAPVRVVSDFFAFPGTDATNLRNGVFVASGDVDGDGFADLIFGGGPGGAPRVFILSGALVSTGNVAGAQATPIGNFFVAGNADDRGGVRLATTNTDGDTKADVVVGSGAGSPARVRVYLGANFSGSGEPGVFQDVTVFGGAALPGGVFVG